MTLNYLWIRVIPLPLRELVLRLLLPSAITNILVNIIANVIANDLDSLSEHTHIAGIMGVEFSASPAFFALARILIPLTIILHHILRLWPRKLWLVICEALFSLAEITVVGVLLVPDAQRTLAQLSFTTGADTSVILLQGASSLFMDVSSFIAFLILLCDILSSRGKNILHQYDFSAGLCRPGLQWSFIFGRFTTKKRFSTDGIFIRCIRGAVAILCLLIISSLVFYAFILQPVQWGQSPRNKIFKIAVPRGALSSTLETIVGQHVGGVFSEPRPLQAVVAMSDISNSHQHPTVSVNLTSFSPGLDPPLLARDCTNGTQAEVTFVYCPDVLLPAGRGTFLEMLITIGFAGVSGDAQVYLGITKSVEDIFSTAEPINLSPGSTLHGISSIIVKERFLGRQAAALGISQYRQFAIVNARALMPDSSPPLPVDNNTAILRITIQTQPDIQVEQEYLEGSVISGFAIVGGTWTLINGIFAAIFGSTLLLVLFGIKPLSIYGLVHYFRPTRTSLVDGDYALSPEERDRIVGMLRQHLLDVGDEERTPEMSSPHYSRVGALPQFDRSYCDTGTQT